jgi:hypothetical protein
MILLCDTNLPLQHFLCKVKWFQAICAVGTCRDGTLSSGISTYLKQLVKSSYRYLTARYSGFLVEAHHGIAMSARLVGSPVPGYLAGNHPQLAVARLVY